MMLTEERKKELLDSIYTTDTGKGEIYAKTPSAQLKRIVPFLENYRMIYEMANISSMPCLKLEEDSDEVITFLMQEIVYLKIICDDNDLNDEWTPAELNPTVWIDNSGNGNRTASSVFKQWCNQIDTHRNNPFLSVPRNYGKHATMMQHFMK